VRTKAAEGNIAMKLGLFASSPSSASSTSFSSLYPLGLGAVALALAVGCSSSSPPGSLFNGGQDGGVPNGPPHALGVILLGESHFSGAGSATPVVLASFFPDASTKPVVCSTTIDGCTVPTLPTCDGKAGPLCAQNQVCSLDATCHASCIQACTLGCASDEECYFASPNAPACRKVETFDAGAIAFAGTTTPITLYPPYSFAGSGSGSPFLAKSSLEVQGSGATGAGFAPFDERFTATTFMQTSPALSTLSPSVIFGAGPIPVGWVPGNDTVVVSVSGPLGSATCAATDALGTFSVPRSVVTAVSGVAGTPSLTVSVSRERVEEKTDGRTKGTMVTATVQPVGYLDLTTSSTESFSFQGCSGGETMCGVQCVSLLSSSTNCGSCGVSCGTSYCNQGTCFNTTTCGVGLTSCNGACVSLTTSPSNCGACGNSCPVGETCSGGTCAISGTCGSLTSCPDGCENLLTSVSDCGSCGYSCAVGQVCSGGNCITSSTTCSSCESTAETGLCATYYTTCADDATCTDYESCMSSCAGSTTCQSSCASSYPTGQSEAEQLQSCICSQQCSSSCATDAFCTTAL
jgi:hypothetical protein